jgi:hypothetical protein
MPVFLFRFSPFEHRFVLFFGDDLTRFSIGDFFCISVRIFELEGSTIFSDFFLGDFIFSQMPVFGFRLSPFGHRFVLFFGDGFTGLSAIGSIYK